MKRTVLFTVFFALTISGIKSQNINKGQLTNVVFYALYGDTANPNNYPASDYPNIYFDLQEGSVFEKIAKHLGYLEFGDGISALWRDNPTFNTAQIPYHVSIIKVLLEAWDVPIISSGVSLPYSDVNPSTLYYDYVLTAYDLGMLPNSSQLNPMSGISLTVVLNYITFLENNVPTPSQSDLMDEDNYFLPNNLTPDNLGFARGMEQGVFSHYAKNSFVIPDIKFNLGFSHFYSTQMVETPEGFYPIKPLGRGWSHTYNSYITFNQNVGLNGEDFFYVVWPDGTIHVYDEDEEEYLTKGVYDEFDEDTSTRIYITKKNQVRYKYEKLDSDRDIYYLTEIRDPNGNEINIDYENAEEDDTRRIEEVEAPSGKTLEFKYLDDTDLVERVEDPMGRHIDFEYTGFSNWVYQYPVLVAFQDAKGNNTTYQYNTSNAEEEYLLKRIDLPRGNQIKAKYDDNRKLEEFQIDDDDPIEIVVDYDYGDEEFTSTVETPIPSGIFTQEYTFNQNGMMTEYSSDTDDMVIDYPSSGVNVLRPTDTNLNGVSIEYEYDSDGNVTEIYKGNGDSVETFDYDGHNNLTEYTDANGNTTYFYYDNDENLIEIEDALGNSIYYTYDSYGQLISVTNQEGITVDYTYESDGALSSVSAPEGINSSFSYDGVNRLLQRNDNGLVSSYEYDDNDNLTSFTNSGGFTTTYDYDANDNLTEITNANSIVTSFVYDDQDRVIEEHFDNLVKEYEYGDEGYLEEYTKPSGIDIDYEYDNDGRLEETGTITDISYNNENLVEDISNVNGTVYFEYDDLNRVDEVTTIHGYTVEYDYLDSGHLEEITYPTINGIEIEVDYGYDDKNRLVDVVIYTNNSNDAISIAEFDYKDDDRLERIEYGNGITRVNFYDNAGRLDQIFTLNTSTNEVIYGNIMTLDTRGNILQEQEEFQPVPPGYNPGSSDVPITYGYDDNNHILEAGGANYNVDDDGNMTSIDGGPTFVYDVDDRLTQYADVDNSFTFKYNPYGQRVEADRNGTVTKYVRDVLQDNILIELDGNNDPINYYIYTPSGMLLARMKPTGELYYYHGDTRGSVVAITDESAAITHQYRYDDFGRLVKKYEPADDANFFRYVGTYGVEYELNDLYYMRARYYKPSIGRFLSEDPVWSTNLYPYADNNPINRVDPYGQLSDEVIDNKIIPILEKIVGAYHIGADIIGLIPGLGEWADGYNALLYSIEGDYTNAALSGAAAIPIAGWAATTGKYGKKLSNIVPENWIIKSTKKGNGIRYIDPSNPGNIIRIMPGNPNSSNMSQRRPYVKNLSNGQYLDVNGNPLPNGNMPEAHIPLNKFKL